MANGSSDNGNRLERIENALDRLTASLETTKQIANSNSRAIQAMMEQQTTERLKHEETMAELKSTHQESMANMRDIMNRVVETQSGLTRILINHDEDRPTILRRLMVIENKVDQILDKEQD